MKVAKIFLIFLYCCNVTARVKKTFVKLPKARDGICGRALDDFLPSRIVGGKKALLGEFPWMAMFIYLKPGNSAGSHCGGSLISTQHVLSVAHCVDQRSFPRILETSETWILSKVRLGEFDLETDVDCDTFNNYHYCSYSPIDFNIAQYFIHEFYVPTEVGNPFDIAIIHLSETVIYTNFIKPICLPNTHEDIVNVDFGVVTVAGFGRTETSSYSTKILKAEIDIVERETCSGQYRFQGRKIFNTQICASRVDTDSCDGDSGNALIKQNDTTRVSYQIGIVSFGPRRCGKVYPGIYINVIEFIDWIRNKVET